MKPYHLASKRATESQSKSKMRYDQGIHHIVLEPGDRVLVRTSARERWPWKTEITLGE